MPPRFEFSERERVGYFQLKASVSRSVGQSVGQSVGRSVGQSVSVTDHSDYYVNYKMPD